MTSKSQVVQSGEAQKIYVDVEKFDRKIKFVLQRIQVNVVFILVGLHKNLEKKKSWFLKSSMDLKKKKRSKRVES